MPQALDHIEKVQQDDDRNRDTEQPQQNSTHRDSPKNRKLEQPGNFAANRSER
jgi:hypothetical protein